MLLSVPAGGVYRGLMIATARRSIRGAPGRARNEMTALEDLAHADAGLVGSALAMTTWMPDAAQCWNRPHGLSEVLLPSAAVNGSARGLLLTALSKLLLAFCMFAGRFGDYSRHGYRRIAGQ